MCGIVGILALGSGRPPVDRAELIAIREAMAHRGPDGAGLWLAADGRVGLAHRRLAIIDTTASANQPMVSANGRFAIVFNGEMTHYKALRRELIQQGHTFRTQSDTEVLLALYERHGPAMVHRLHGMFTFAIWDCVRRRLFAVRGPFGILPFYYAYTDGVLRFASQVKALRRSMAVPADPDPAGLAGFLLLGYVPEPHTCFAHIHALPAGSALTFDEHGLEIRPYRDIADSFRTPAPDLKDEARHELLREAVAGAVDQSLVADVPVGLFLSGGVDSTMIAALATRSGARLTSVTVGFPEFRGRPQDETAAAAAAARRFGTRHVTRWVDAAEFSAEHDRLLAAMDQPSIDGANTYFAAKAAAEAGLKVVLSGVGGDELFGSYPSFSGIPRLVATLGGLPGVKPVGRAFRLVSAPLLRHLDRPKWAGLLEYGTRVEDAYLLRRGLFMPWELPDLLGAEVARIGWRSLDPLLRMERSAAGLPTPHARIAVLELTWYMRNQLLRDTDWAGLAHGVEVRPPLLYLPLLDKLGPLIASRRPPDKHELVASVSSIAPAIAERQKIGFIVPWREWILRGKSVGLPSRIWARHVLDTLTA
jgi:asparagine synthase (glutamine-hydrolysing)